ncbi:hypothetical protein FXO38_16365 [Capsicum annuum]|nr:hypothetical protein FXO38_16365 [Capsicum annuum]KAF3666344.1 hypothetical protein FXO37_10605 [Capsicum annuum]
MDVIMYYLRKKYKNKNFPITRYTTTDCFFKVYIDKAYVNYYNEDVAKDLATQDVFFRTDEVVDMKMSLINIIKGLSTRAGQPWHMFNKVFVPINCDSVFHWVLTVISLKDRCIRVDCGVFVAVYAEYLLERLDIPYSGIDAQYHRLRYATFLCKYRSEKAENGYFSNNDNPLRTRSKFTPKEIDRILHIK